MKLFESHIGDYFLQSALQFFISKSRKIEKHEIKNVTKLASRNSIAEYRIFWVLKILTILYK